MTASVHARWIGIAIAICAVGIGGVLLVRQWIHWRKQSLIDKIEQSTGGMCSIDQHGVDGVAFLGEEEVDDADLQRLCDIAGDRLFLVVLTGSQVTDKGVAALRDSKRLHALVIRDAPVSDRALSTLNVGSSLHTLVLDNTCVTGTCVGRFVHLRSLRLITAL